MFFYISNLWYIVVFFMINNCSYGHVAMQLLATLFIKESNVPFLIEGVEFGCPI